MLPKYIGQSSKYYLLYDIQRKFDQLVKLAPNGNWGKETAQKVVSTYTTRVQESGGVVEGVDHLTSEIQHLKDIGVWDKLSAAWIPSGYAEGKLYAVKGGAAADFGFTRAGTRTRVGPDGQVEEAPYNFVSYSEQLSMGAPFWTILASSVSITENAISGPDGKMTADVIEKLTSTAAFRCGANGERIDGRTSGTWSVKFWAKCITQSSTSILLDFVDNPKSAVEINDEWAEYSVEMISGESVAGGFDFGLPVDFPIGGKVSVTKVQITPHGNRDYFPTTNRQHVPSIDFTGGTPKLSLEPARTNYITHSETLDHSSWTTAYGGIVERTSGPDGRSNSGFIIRNSASTKRHGIEQALSNSSTTMAISFYGKAIDAGVYLAVGGFNFLNNNELPIFNFHNGTVSIPATTNTFKSATIEEVLDEDGNFTGWYYCVVIAGDLSGTSRNPAFYVAQSATDTTGAAMTYLGDGRGVAISKVMVEAGSYATSYIPTGASTASRIADIVPALTGVSEYIGQTEGSIFFDIELEPDSVEKQLYISDGTVTNSFVLSFSVNAIRFSAFKGGVAQTDLFFVNPHVRGRYKGCVTYSENSVDGFLNGEKVFTDNSFSTPATSEVKFNHPTAARPVLGGLHCFGLSKSKLLDEEAIALTTL